MLQRLQSRKIPSLTQLRYLPRLLEAREKRTVGISLAIALIAAITLTTRLWAAVTVPLPDVGGSYTEGLVGSPRFINPILASGNHVDRDLSTLLFSGLLRATNEGVLEPDLAKEYTVSDDQRVYTFILRDNLTWHDEQPLTVDDVVFTINSIQDAAFKSPLRVSFSGVEVKRIDDKTVSFILQQPFPSFINTLTVGIIPQHIWYSIPPAQASLAEANIRPIGSGPFAFKTLTKDTIGSIRSITLARNTAYHRDIPYIKEMTLKFYPDFETALDALKNKNVNGLASAPLEYKDELQNNRSIQLKNLIIPQYNALFFNPEKNPILKETSIRKALAYAIDRERIVREVLEGSGSIIDTPLILNAIETHEGRVRYGFNLEEANALLEKAGWKRDAATGKRMKDTNPLTITLTTSDQQENTATADIIKQNWESAGITVNLNIISKNKIRKESIEPREYQALLFAQILVAHQDPYVFWHSSLNRHPGSNLSVLANKDIDAALEQLRSTTDPATKIELYKKFETKLTNEVFAIFLYNPTYLYPLGKQVHGTDDLQHIATPSDRFNSINHWYVETKRRLK